MTRAEKLLDAMRANPQGGWRIEDVEQVCRQHGLTCSPPSRGDHYKISHPEIPPILTIPAHRPVKPVYIRKLVAMIDSIANGGSDAGN